MRKFLQIMLVAGSLAMFAGCAAQKPLRFYSLEKPPSASATADSSGASPIGLVVGHLSSPRLLRDDRIVYGMSDVEMGVYHRHRWAEPPPEMIETMLIEQLRATGQYKSVQRLGSSARGEYIVRGRLIALNEIDSPSGIIARFAMELDLFQLKSGMIVWTQTYQHDEPVAKKTVNDVVEALQRNVQAGLGQLTTSMGQYIASQPAK